MRGRPLNASAEVAMPTATTQQHPKAAARQPPSPATRPLAAMAATANSAIPGPQPEPLDDVGTAREASEPDLSESGPIAWPSFPLS